MITMEPHVKRWYDHLEAGEIMGKRCPECGAIEFPPVPVCNRCGHVGTEWVPMEGKGQLVSFSVMRFMDPVQAKYGQRVLGQVELAEGTSFTATVEGVDIDRVEELYDRLPIPVTLDISQYDGYKFVSFRLAI